MSGQLRTEFDMRELYPLLSEVLESGGEFRLYPKGTSMLPLLREGEDSVLLKKCTELEVGGIYLYRRKGGKFVLHRLVALEETRAPVFRGDNQDWLEYGIAREDVLAVVSGIFKKDVPYPMDSPRYRSYLRRLSSPFYRFWRFLPRRVRAKLTRK